MSLFNGFESQMGNAVAVADGERTRYDKILSKEEMFRVQQLLKKETFNLDEVNEVMSIANSTETKLTRFDEYERKILGKFLNIWLGNFVKRYSKVLIAQKYYDGIWDKLSERNKKLRADIVKMMTEQFKQSINSYFFAIRSPLSLEGSLIETLSANNQEMQYQTSAVQNPGLVQQQTSWGSRK